MPTNSTVTFYLVAFHFYIRLLNDGTQQCSVLNMHDLGYVVTMSTSKRYPLSWRHYVQWVNSGQCPVVSVLSYSERQGRGDNCLWQPIVTRLLFSLQVSELHRKAVQWTSSGNNIVRLPSVYACQSHLMPNHGKCKVKWLSIIFICACPWGL